MPEPDADLIRTRATLLERMKNTRDGDSWQDFFDTYWALIFGTARRAGLSEAEAQDVVQEVMISVAKDIPTFKFDPARGSFKSWLLIKTRWKVVGQFRKRGPSAKQEIREDPAGVPVDLLQQLPDPASLMQDEFWEKEYRDHLLAVALGKVKQGLDPEKYQIFDFYVLKGWSAERVAQAFGVPVDRVYMTKFRVGAQIEDEVRRLERETT